jgi:hypothetical protein
MYGKTETEEGKKTRKRGKALQQMWRLWTDYSTLQFKFMSALF